MLTTCGLLWLKGELIRELRQTSSPWICGMNISQMWLYNFFLIQLTLTIFVWSDTDSLFDNDASKEMSWDFFDVDSAPSTSLFSGGRGDEFISAVIPIPLSCYKVDSNFLTKANDFDMEPPPGSVPANEQILDWFANAGSPCVSDVDDFQSMGKLRAARRDGACRSGYPKTGERKTNEDPSDGSSNSKPVEIPDAFTAPSGEPNNMFYPSENQDECPSSVYGARKTPMCDSGNGYDFLRYSVLGFIALDIIEGCLPCTCTEPCRHLSSDAGRRAHRECREPFVWLSRSEDGLVLRVRYCILWGKDLVAQEDKVGFDILLDKHGTSRGQSCTPPQILKSFARVHEQLNPCSR